MRMKNLAALLVIALFVGLGVIQAGDGDTEYKETTIAIDGMTCGGCVGAVKIQLKRTDGVKDYEVSLEKGEAQVTYDPQTIDPEAIAASIEKAGFEAKVKDQEA